MWASGWPALGKESQRLRTYTQKEGCKWVDELPLLDARPAPKSCSGLQWREFGTSKPNPGIALANKALAEALGRGCLEFTEAEWANFGVDDVKMEHYVVAQGTHYVPSAVYNAVPVAGEATGLSLKTRWRGWRSGA